MPNGDPTYFIKNIRRKLVLLTSAIAYIKDLDRRRKYIELIEEMQDEDLATLEALIKKGR